MAGAFSMKPLTFGKERYNKIVRDEMAFSSLSRRMDNRQGFTLTRFAFYSHIVKVL